MTIDWWTLGLQTVNVVVLVWLLAHYLFRPIAKIIADRQTAAHAALDEAEAARTQAEAARDAAKAEAAEVASRRAALIAAAQEEAGREKQRLIDAARAEALKARAEADATLARERASQRQAMAEEAGTLAADIAARLVGRLPDSARIAGFVDGLTQAVAGLPDATRAGLGADGPVRLRAARALTGDERERLERRLAEVLGRDVTVSVETDATLIAGLELDAPHAIVRNHFRADLDRIKGELIGHD